MTRFINLLLAAMLIVLATPTFGYAQDFPTFSDTGVVDAANLLSPEQETALSQKLITQKKQMNGRSLMVATIPDLQGYDISDYGYRLGRAWAVGSKEADDGVLLIIAPNDRTMSIEVGYGLEGVLGDAVSARIIRNVIAPRFKAGDFPGGINAGVDEIERVLALPPDEAAAFARKVAQEDKTESSDGVPIMLIFWIIIILFFILPMFLGRRGGRRHRGGSGPVIIWGPGMGGDWGNSDRSGGWGNSGGWGGGDSGGGFSGGGSFGGGGASGDW